MNNLKLKKIVNVYQPDYKNSSAQGFGDFLNGCFCLLQICIRLNLTFDINIENHPISKYFIQNEDSLCNDIDHNNIYFLKVDDNIRSNKYKCYNYLIKYLNSINVETLYIFCNFDPFWSVQEYGRNIIQKKLKPIVDIDNNINEILEKLNIQQFEYDIIHIRSGDKYLLNPNNCICREEINKYEILIHNKIYTPNKKYILISDNIHLKKHIKLPGNIYILDTKISHTGENANFSDEALKNTIIDFYLIEKAKKIISISLQSRGGTGFSKLAAIMFNKEYESLLIDLGFHLY